jgi:hypothetical protein
MADGGRPRRKPAGELDRGPRPDDPRHWLNRAALIDGLSASEVRSKHTGPLSFLHEADAAQNPAYAKPGRGAVEPRTRKDGDAPGARMSVDEQRRR